MRPALGEEAACCRCWGAKGCRYRATGMELPHTGSGATSGPAAGIEGPDPLAQSCLVQGADGQEATCCEHEGQGRQRWPGKRSEEAKGAGSGGVRK